jgi:hypothetical protein
MFCPWAGGGWLLVHQCPVVPTKVVVVGPFEGVPCSSTELPFAACYKLDSVQQAASLQLPCAGSSCMISGFVGS